MVNARREEIQYIINRVVWEIRTIEECWRKTGKAPIGVRWVDTNKGSEEESDVRSRLVARDFRDKKDKEREDLFAGTPPLEAERMQFSTDGRRGSEEDDVLSFPLWQHGNTSACADQWLFCPPL